MIVKTIRDKKTIESHFRKNTDYNIYSIGDLDDFFWMLTEWYVLYNEKNIEQIALLYSGNETPTLIGISDRNNSTMYELIEKLRSKLPEKFYAHFSGDIVKVFGEKNIIENYGMHFKMALREKDLLIKKEDRNITRLSVNDIEAIRSLYEISYPENFFDTRMLETGKYFGYYDKVKLIGVAGIHVYSEKYKVAALGNITIMPEYRGRSIGQKLTSALCLDLLGTVDNIGLNVYSENQAAISCYKKIGFEIAGEFCEYLIRNKK
ncbi:MAG: GNAT family N-acetyltransferase [Ignavibacteria bacterium]